MTMTCPSLKPQHGISLLEIVFVAGVMSTVAAIAVPSFWTAIDDFRTLGAVRYLASRLHEARMEAVKRSANTAFRFIRIGDGYAYAVYLDGNGDGVRGLDVDGGADPELRPREQLSDNFPGVAFGALPDLPAPDPGGTPPGTDPIRVGASDLLTFTPLGTATPGSLYLRGRRQAQYVIRVLGETGRTRILKFNSASRRWRPL